MRQEMHPSSFRAWGLGFMVDGLGCRGWIQGVGLSQQQARPVFLGKLPMNTLQNSSPLFRFEGDGFLHFLREKIRAARTLDGSSGEAPNLRGSQHISLALPQ